eukprot:gene56487-50202_t
MGALCGRCTRLCDPLVRRSTRPGDSAADRRLKESFVPFYAWVGGIVCCTAPKRIQQGPRDRPGAAHEAVCQHSTALERR